MAVGVLYSNSSWGHCVVFLGKIFTMPVSTQVYKWVPAHCWGNLTECCLISDGLASHPGTETGVISAENYRLVGQKRLDSTVLKQSLSGWIHIETKNVDVP